MTGRYRPYPDLWGPKLRFITRDAAMVLWIVVWIALGVTVHDAFATLQVLAEAVIATGAGITATGTQIDQVVTGVQGVASTLAWMERALRHALAAVLTLVAAPLGAVARALQTIGQQLTHALEGLQHTVAGAVWGVGSTLATAVDPLLSLAHTLTDLGASVGGAGQALQAKVGDLQNIVTIAPTIQAGLARAVRPLHALPQGIMALGRGTVAHRQQELVAIGHLAWLMGVLVAAVPVAWGLWRYLRWRSGATRSFRHLDAILRQPGAAEVAATLQVLAGRALYTLPYDRLMRYTQDPLAAWHTGRYQDLARAAMADEGLDLERYLRCQDGRSRPLSPREQRHQVSGRGEHVTHGREEPAGTTRDRRGD